MPDPTKIPQRQNINRRWKFFLGERAGAESPTFDDGEWQDVGLPHSFDLPYFRTPEFYVGAGWYRKRLDVPAEWAGKRLRLEFEGAFQVAAAYVNGAPVGRHEGGYTAFTFDITDAVVPGGENVLAVRVDNEWSPRIAPRAGEHVFPGGIYRDVYLVVTEPLHVAPWGVGVTTPGVSVESATVRVTTEVANNSDEAKRCKVITTVMAPDGTSNEIPLPIGETQDVRDVPAHATVTFDRAVEAIADPMLWHPDNPFLYTVLTRVYDGEEETDRIETRFGIRWFEWTADRGFFLNGEPLYLRGANAHQDHSGWGIAITQEACRRDVRLMKECGFNFVRGAHYPHHAAFAQACDEQGLIFWSENCFWGKGGFGPEGYWNASAYPIDPADVPGFAESCKQQLREMIRRNRNSPSIVVWSMTNEAFFTFNLDQAKVLMADLVNLCHELDPTRLAAIGGAQRGDVDKIGDVAGYNGDGATLFIDPGVPNMVSEYGAISKPVDAYEPFFGDLQKERFTWRGGEAIWAGFDYGSIAGRQGLKGVVRHDRLPKRSWYWYRHEYRDKPAPQWPTESPPAKLRLDCGRLWDAVVMGIDATDDAQIVVTVLGADGRAVRASPPVTLTIEHGPGEFPTGRSITFDANTDIVIADGQAAIAMRSYEAGESFLRATSPGLLDATLVVRTIGEPEYVEGQTPLPHRPYTPPKPSAASVKAMGNVVNVARDRPSRASSELADHPAWHANDADKSTYWSAAETGEGQWLQVDLEGFYQLSDCRLTFAAAGNYRYVVDTSSDRANWRREIDRSKTARADVARHDVFEPGTIARYVRVTIVGLPDGATAAVAEIEVHGVLSVR